MKSKILLVVLVFLLTISFASAIDIASDDFECNGFTCGTGWDYGWSYSGDCEITTLSSPIGNYQMRGQSSCDVSRSIDTSSYQNVKVSFYATASSLESADHCYYYYDGIELLHLQNGDDDGTLKYYEYNVVASPTGDIQMVTPTTSGDYCYIDNVLITGDTLAPELGLYSELKYQKNSLMSVDLTSSVGSIDHQFEVFLNNGTLLCNQTLVSPIIPYTLFTGTCQLPDIEQNNAYIHFSTSGANTTIKTFNIVGSSMNSNEVSIDRVYFSRQVLQGGSTEVFALTSGNSPIENIYLTLTFPNNDTRIFDMYPTVNTGEYRAFISDTYQTGNTSFSIRAESGVYYDTYVNKYYVAPYSIDFVDAVNEVYSILTQPPGMTVAGTDYYSGEQGMTFLQLTEEGLPVDNATCHVTVYYPNISIWLDNQAMIPGDNGLHYYPFVAPETEGIYMITAYCEYYREMSWFFDLEGDSDFPVRTVITADEAYGDGINLNSHTDGGYVFADAERIGNDYITDVYYNFTHDESQNITDATLYWMGESNNDNDLTFYWWNWTSSAWVMLPNDIILAGTVAPNALQPSGVGELVTNDLPDESMNANGTIMIRVYGFHDTADFNLWTNWLNIQSSNLVGSTPQYLRGGGEIHISNAADQIYDDLSVLLNRTEQILNNTVITINMTDGLNASLDYAILQIENLSTEFPIVDIGGTEYQSNEEGLIGVRLSKAVGNVQTPILNATCQANIVYPNATEFISNASMIEYGNGVYYYNFTTPSTEGVYIYYVDCLDGSKTYYSMNTFHIAPWANYINTLINFDESSLLSYLMDINATVTTIDGRTISIENIVNDSNNRLVLLNGTIYDMYALLLQMNQTITNIYSYAQSINATVVDIQSTVNGIEQVVLDINGTVTTIDANVIEINNTVTDIYFDTQQIRQDLIYMNNTLNNIYNTTLTIDGNVVTINGKVDQIYDAIVTLNGTVNGIENVTLTIDGKVDVIDGVVDAIKLDTTFISNAVIYINTTTTDTNTYVHTIDGKVDVIDANVDFIKDAVITINGTVNGIENVTLQIQGTVSNIEGLVTEINDTTHIIDGKVDQLANDIFVLNNTSNSITNSLVNMNGTLISILGTVNGIENTVIDINGTVYGLEEALAQMDSSVIQWLQDIYDTQCNCSLMLEYLDYINATTVDIQSTVNDIESYMLVNISGDLYNIQTDIDGIEVTLLNHSQQLLDINSNLTVIDSKIDDLGSALVEINGTTYYIKNKVDGIEVSLIDINGTVVATQNTVNQIDTNLIALNGSVYLMQQDIDGIVLSLINMNGTLVDTNTVVHTIDGNLVLLNNTLYSVKNTVEGIEISLVDMNNTIISTQQTINQINGTVNSIESAVITIDGKVDDIYTGIITINGTINGIENTVITINGTLNSVESKIDVIDTNVDTILLNLAQINGTINSIENGVLNLSLCCDDVKDMLANMNTTLVDTNGVVHGLEITLNNSIDYFNTTLSGMNQTLNDIHTLVFTINQTTFEIQNLTVTIDEKIDSLTNLSIIVNGTVFSYLAELEYIQELIINQTDYLVIALADISFFGNGTNASDYYDNLLVLTPSILETQMWETGIDILQDPIEGDLYKLNYYIFNANTGDLTQESQIVVGDTGNYELGVTSELLAPVNAVEQDYEVWVRVEMLNGVGLWQSFPLDYVGPLKVVHLNDNGPRDVGLYDVIVKTTYDRLDVGETVTADILLKNTGDDPDQDTILTYWLEDGAGNKYGTTKEQFLEVPSGNTLITRELTLPLGASLGEWTFQAEYETVVQPKIDVYDSFEVAELTWFDKLQDRLPVFIRNNWLIFWGLVFLFLLIIFILLVLAVGDKVTKKKKYKKEVYVDAHKRTVWSDTKPTPPNVGPK